MKDSEFPSFVDDEEEDAQATMMWDRDEVDLSDLDVGLERDPSRPASSSPASAGLDEGELFGDLPDLSSAQRAASIPVQGGLVQTTRPPAPANVNATAPASPKPGRGVGMRPIPARYWAWSVAVAALAGVIASAVYVLAG